jgi:hypothetical protein
MREQLTTRFAAVMTAEPAVFGRPVSPPGDSGCSVHGPCESPARGKCGVDAGKRIRATVVVFPF